MIEVTERIDINKFVDFTHRNSHGYDGLMMLRLLLLAFADTGYALVLRQEKVPVKLRFLY